MIGYARVSTEEQHLDAQLDALERCGCEIVFKDLGVSGRTAARKGLGQALCSLERGDTLVVWRLDRLGRSLVHLIGLIETFSQEGVEFRSLTEAIDTNSAGGKLIFHIMAAMAEFERQLISERTRAGMDAARARGKHIGRPTILTAAQVKSARRSLASGRTSVKKLARALGVHPDTLSRSLRKVNTP
ncbi:recombinase family protein [Pacificispira sp.]|uniref:recombinase family protein n=1 Tax=Pacificispira sp. TaxID=2888761 RepID=UPI003B51B9D3